MTKERAKIVCQSALDSATDGLGVWQYLLYKGTRENLKGKPKSSLFEAIVGAIFTDGGYEQAKAFVERHGILQELFRKTSGMRRQVIIPTSSITKMVSLSVSFVMRTERISIWELTARIRLLQEYRMSIRAKDFLKISKTV